MSEDERQAFAVGSRIASLGPYTLYRINDDYYQLHGPDASFSKAWLVANLPAGGDWSTTWSGDDALTVHITR